MHSQSLVSSNAVSRALFFFLLISVNATAVTPVISPSIKSDCATLLIRVTNESIKPQFPNSKIHKIGFTLASSPIKILEQISNPTIAQLTEKGFDALVTIKDSYWTHLINYLSQKQHEIILAYLTGKRLEHDPAGLLMAVREWDVDSFDFHSMSEPGATADTEALEELTPWAEDLIVVFEPSDQSPEENSLELLITLYHELNHSYIDFFLKHWLDAGVWLSKKGMETDSIFSDNNYVRIPHNEDQNIQFNSALGHILHEGSSDRVASLVEIAVAPLFEFTETPSEITQIVQKQCFEDLTEEADTGIGHVLEQGMKTFPGPVNEENLFAFVEHIYSTMQSTITRYLKLKQDEQTKKK